MDKQEAKIKSSNLERYKSGQSKFFSLEQSRQLRALKKKQEQKDSRDAILNKIRRAVADTPESKLGQSSLQVSQSSTTKTFSKKKRFELGIKRHQEMLIWKEQNRKRLEQEKKARKPVFKTGVFEPDKPQYLQDVFVDKKDQNTPFKFSVVGRDSSAKKSSSLLLSASKGNIFDRKSSRALSFHSGATPLTSGASTSASNIDGRRRANRVFRPPPSQFGITPLPKTPSLGGVMPLPRTPGLVAPSRSFNILKESKSFAPNIFNFQAPKGIQRYATKHSSALQSSVFLTVHNSPSKEEESEFAKEVGLHNFENDESGVSAEHLENNEFERSRLRDTYMIDNNKDNEIETQSIENDINTNSEEDPQNITDSEENLLTDEENDMNQSGEIQPLEEKSNKASNEEVKVKSNLREKIDEHEDKLESVQLDCSSDDYEYEDMVESEQINRSNKDDEHENNCSSEDYEHEDMVESGQINRSNEDDEHENKSESGEVECSSEDLVRKVIVQDVKCELSGFKEESNSGTLPTVSVEEEEEVLTELSNENKENISEKNLRDYKPKIDKDSRIRDYLEDDEETISDKKGSIKSSTKKRSRSLAKFTPPLSKLRPRTPCSRSTRRSLLAHCNTPGFDDDHHIPMTTPVSRRRRGKKLLTVTPRTELDSEPTENFDIKAISEVNSANKTASQGSEDETKPTETFDIRAIPEINSANKTPSQSTEDELKSFVLSESRIKELENSPFITRSRGSSSPRSSKRKSIFKKVIEELRNPESKSRESSKSLKSKKSLSEPSAKRLRQLLSCPWVSHTRGSSKSSKTLKRRAVLERDSLSVKDFCNAGSPALKNNLITDDGSPALKKSIFPLPLELFRSPKIEEPIDVEESVKDIVCGVVSPLIKKGSSSLLVNEEPSSPIIEASLPPELIQQQTKRISESLDVCVWGPESATNSPVVAMPELQNCNDNLDNIAEANVSPNTETTKPLKGKRRSSKRVSLLVHPDKENVGDAPTIKYPVTPRRRSSRISSVGNNRVSLLPGLYPHNENTEMSSNSIDENEDLILLDTPAVVTPSGGNGKIKSRLSERVSLLPGLSSHPEEEDQSHQSPPSNEQQPPGDLITWDSPLVASGRRKYNKKKSNTDTPLRRSRRFSQI